MANKIYVANEQTVQSVKTEVNSIHSKVGSGSDASSSSTVFGKLNGIVSTSNSILGKTNDITNKVGSVSDVSSSSTIFGKLNGIGAKVSDLLAPLTQKIGNTADTASQQTLFGKLKAVKDDISVINANTVRGAVKSVQRGIVTFNDNDYSSRNEKYIDRTVTISSVNPSKSLILINNSLAGTVNTGMSQYTANTSYREFDGRQSILKSFNSTNFVLSVCYQRYGYSYDGSSSTSTKYGSVSWQVIEFY